MVRNEITDYDVVQLSPEEACAISGGFLWFITAPHLMTFGWSTLGGVAGGVGLKITDKKWHWTDRLYHLFFH
ncbi:hypothetical protein ACCT14_34180 [Rhizobium brockwellii]|jgi:hypothetical protein|uniref:hypothetical protein n=1 Tax=Rhizobium brockwellii TaxID=3019932 RepID=UPI003F9D3828